MEPGSGGGVFTGQFLFFKPTVMAFTSARLSFLVRPFTEGTVIGGSFAAESFAVPGVVLEAAFDAAGAVGGVDDALPVTPWGAAVEAREPSGGIPSTPGAGRASLLAAQASEAASTNDTSMGIENNLFDEASSIRN
jgi:hypothetical protein